MSVTNSYQHHLVEEVRSGRLTRRGLIRRATIVGVSMPTLSTLLAACGGAGGESSDARNVDKPPRRGGTGRVGLLAPSAEPDPVIQFTPGAVQTTQISGEYLVAVRPDYSLEPRLATSWKANTPREWTFQLRENVKFHDGTTMTADDVVATFDRLTDPESKSAALSAFQGVLSKGNIEKVSALTVKFHLDTPAVDFIYLVSGFNYNSLILPKDYELNTFMKGKSATGPFVLKEYRPSQSAKYVRNPDYWDPKLPYLDEVELKYYNDTGSIALALQSGEIDLIPELSYGDARGGLSGERGVVVRASDSSGYDSLHMRVDQAPFDDVRVRQAVALCLDREALVKSLFGGNAKIANDHLGAPIFPESALVDGEAPQRKQDYVAAKRLLAEAGHPRGFKVTLLSEQGVLELPDYAVSVKEQCRPAGIDVDVKLMSVADYHGSEDNTPWLQTPFGMINWNPRGSVPQSAGAVALCDSLWNSAHWCNGEFNRLIAESNGELDEQRRQKLTAKAAKIQHEEVPIAITFWKQQLRAQSDNVRGIPVGPAVINDVSRMGLA